jgi:hypothetical protein
MGKETEYVFEFPDIDYTLQSVRDGTPRVTDDDIGSTMSVGWAAEDALCFETLSVRPTATIDNLIEV